MRIKHRKRNTISKIKMNKYLYGKSPICHDIAASTQDNIPVIKNAKKLFDSSAMKSNLEHPHIDNNTFSVNKKQNEDSYKKMFFEHSKLVGERKFLKNGTHLFDARGGIYM